MLGTFKNLIVPETKYLPTAPFKICRALKILFIFCMLAAIRFNNKARFDTGEVGKIGRDRMLAPKLPSIDLVVSQMSPKPSFGIG